MKLMRLDDVKEQTGLGRSSIYKFIADGTFPAQVPLGDRAVAWVAEEIEVWIQERINARGNKGAPSA